LLMRADDPRQPTKGRGAQGAGRSAVILEASDGATGMRLVEEHGDLGLLLLDLTLPDREGFALLAELRQSHPALAIVVLSAVQDCANVMRALKLGALGFIPKVGTARDHAQRPAAGRIRRRLHPAADPRPRGVEARPTPKARAPCRCRDENATGISAHSRA
jgi:DNA-binding NarL/FixJ family response regulator